MDTNILNTEFVSVYCNDAYMYYAIFEADLMKMLSSTKDKLKKSVVYKKKRVLYTHPCIQILITISLM